MQIDERHICLVCGKNCDSQVQVVIDRFPIVQFQCPLCAKYAVSYTLWFRLKLSGWEGVAMDQVRGCLEQDRMEDSGVEPLLVIAQAERHEAGALRHSPEWRLCMVD